MKNQTPGRENKLNFVTELETLTGKDGYKKDSFEDSKHDFTVEIDKLEKAIKFHVSGHDLKIFRAELSAKQTFRVRNGKIRTKVPIALMKIKNHLTIKKKELSTSSVV